MIDTLSLVPLEVPARPGRRLSLDKLKLDKLKKLLSTFSFSSDTDFSNVSHSSSSSSSRQMRNFKKNKLFFIPVGVVVVIVLFLLVRTVMNSNSVKSVAGVSDDRINVPAPKATQTLNKNFAFPLKDETGKEVSKIGMVLTTAELRDEIVVKGQKATAVKGRVFLILNLKLTNDYSKSVQINTRDYIRLTVNGSSEKLAADIHNDPVEVQAISTKYTRLGFPINDSDKDLTLYVGEINGKKEVVKLTLP